jgi:hypothetical protein
VRDRERESEREIEEDVSMRRLDVCARCASMLDV